MDSEENRKNTAPAEDSVKLAFTRYLNQIRTGNPPSSAEKVRAFTFTDELPAVIGDTAAPNEIADPDPRFSAGRVRDDASSGEYGAGDSAGVGDGAGAFVGDWEDEEPGWTVVETSHSADGGEHAGETSDAAYAEAGYDGPGGDPAESEDAGGPAPDGADAADGYSDSDESDEEGPPPRGIALRVLRLLLLAVKWVIIYMGRFISTVFKTSIVIALTVAFGVIGAGVGAVYGYVQDMEPITDIMLEMKIQTSYVYDADGNQIARLAGSSNINRQLVRYEDISPHLPKALIAIEDKRFESHNGVDLKRIAGAGLQFLLGGSDAHGASTITQQLVKNVTGKKNETLERKVQEWFLAVDLEKTMEKWKILELYLNVVYFGNGSYGVSSASRTYFGKPVSDLSVAESAFLIGITNSPGLYNPYTEKGLVNAYRRQGIILDEMLDQGMITEAEREDARNEKLSIVPKAVTTAVVTKPQSYFVDCVIEEVRNDLMTEKGMTSEMAFAQIYNYGLQIYTTQSTSVQSALDTVFNSTEYFPLINADAQKNNEQPQGAMVILDPYTAQIKAVAGGYGEKLADRTFNRATQARRQPGSSIKPIAVYGPALDQRVVTLATVVDDTPSHLDPNDPERIYPGNSTGDFRGLTTVRNAIRRSVNVVAAKTWLRIPDTSRSYLDKAGINRDTETQVALALGGLHKGVTPLEMAAAYVPFVNRGMYYAPTTYTKVLDSEGRVILDKTVRLPSIIYSEQAAALMTSALEDVVKSGTGTSAALFEGAMPAAGKTGTTNDNADRWFVGYTPYYVAATWYGYDNRIKKIALQNEELGNAMKIWKTVMEDIHDGLEPKPFPVPDQIVTANVCAYSGKAPTALCRNDPRGSAVRTEMFIQGTEPRETDPCDVHVISRICQSASDALGGEVAPGEFCPPEDIVERVAIRRSVPFEPQPGDPMPADWTYEAKALQPCPYHTAEGIAPEFAPPEELPPDETAEGGGDVLDDGGADGEPGAPGDGQASENPSVQGSPRPLRTPRPDRRPEAETTEAAAGGNAGELGTGEAGATAPRRTPR